MQFLFSSNSYLHLLCLNRQISAGYLQNATHRLEQMAILDVLRLYTEQIALDKLNELKENHVGNDMDVIVEIAKLGKKPSSKVIEHSGIETYNFIYFFVENTYFAHLY